MGRTSDGTLRPPSWPALTWLGLLVLALAAGVLLAVNSDAANTDVRTAPPPAKSPDGLLTERLGPLWSARESVDDQRTVASNTVIISTEHGVRGLDLRTGEERWRYLRSTATLCDLTVLDDVVVALFRTAGRCNEAVALEAGTGVRRWYRNVDFSGRLSLLGSGTAAVAATPGGIAVLDAGGNSLRWRYNPPEGCELSSIGVGTSGVVVLERCTTGTTWLAGFELYSGQPLWRVPPPPGDVTVLGADGVVSLLAAQQLLILSPRDGSSLSIVDSAPLDAADAVASSGTATATFGGQFGGRGLPLVYLAGTLSAIDPSSGVRLWSVEASGLPASGEVGLVVPEGDAFVIRNPLTGVEISRSVPTGSTGIEGVSRVERAGSILIAVTDGRITAYG